MWVGGAGFRASDWLSLSDEVHEYHALSSACIHAMYLYRLLLQLLLYAFELQYEAGLHCKCHGQHGGVWAGLRVSSAAARRFLPFRPLTSSCCCDPL